MKKCSACKLEKSKEQFAKRSRSKDGLASRCKECKREYDNSYYKKNSDRKNYILENRKESLEKANAYIVKYLSNHPCVHCGEDDIVVLEFDHTEDNKRGCVSVLKRSSLKAVKEEIEKCQVLCANCHRRKTAKQFGWKSRLPL